MTGLRRFFRAARYRQIIRNLAGPRLLRAFADTYPHAFFVEIGSNDGEQHDHLRPFILSRPWRGIMVEPVPYVFERLRTNYEAYGRIALENVAVGDADGQLPFYHLAEPSPSELASLPDWYDGVGSFSREAVAGHVAHIPDIEKRIVCREVSVVTFDTLLKRSQASHVDLLLIDTEGHDWEILRSIDFARWRPRLVIYEHYHLTPTARAATREHLGLVGYETMEEGFDTFCLDTSVDDALTDLWRSLSPAVEGVAAYEEAA
jgi:FkbM family methyltransferase